MLISDSVMAGLDPAIHAFGTKKGEDARHKAGHDSVDLFALLPAKL
jgi:hypothetical protein